MRRLRIILAILTVVSLGPAWPSSAPAQVLTRRSKVHPPVAKQAQPPTPAPKPPAVIKPQGDLPPVQVAPESTGPWWETWVTQSMRGSAEPYPVDIESLVIEALRHSPRVRAISDNSLIRETSILEAHAEFDVRAFMESKFIRTSTPVGDTLTTGGPPRLRDADWKHTAGLRKKTALGGSVELSQRVGLQDSNSTFFLPTQQGNSQLSLSFNQPLLNGAGRAYNKSLIVLAEFDTGAAWDRTLRELQGHLYRITEAHWDLYLQRAALLQKQVHHQRAVKILAELEARQGLDSMRSQIARAKAAVATREAELARCAAAIRNAEATLRALVNAPPLMTNGHLELIPRHVPRPDFIAVDMRDALVTAMQHRPEISEAMQEIKAASVRLAMSKNELLPVLDLVLETYVSGLQGNYRIGSSWAQQFNDGEPSYTAGLRYEVPLGNRAACVRHRRRRIELRQLQNQFQATVELLKSEVEIAVREVETSHREMQGRYRAMVAADADVNYITRRWEMLGGDERAASFLLADLLDSQDRLAAEEFGFARSQVAYVISLANLKRATGTLLEHQRIMPQRACECGVPHMMFQKTAPAGTP